MVETIIGSILSAALLGGANALTAQGQAEQEAEREERAIGRQLASEGLKTGLSGIESAQGIRSSAFQDLMNTYKGMVE